MPWLEIVVILLLLVLNGVFAMSELAVVSSRRSRLQHMAESGVRGGTAAVRLLDEPSRFLSTVQIGITLIGIFAGAYSGATLAGRIGAWLDGFAFIAPNGHAVAVGIVVVAVTYLSLVIGELAPKRIALRNPERVAALIARPMQFLSTLAAPAVWLLSVSTDAVLRLFGIKGGREVTVTEEEVKSMITEGTHAGVFVPEEKRMIEGVLRLADRTVPAIMTPRPEIVWLDVEDDEETLKKEIRNATHSRLLVCRGTIDEVVGIVAAKDLLNDALQGAPLDLSRLTARPLVVPEGVTILRLLDLLKQSGVQMAVVADEYGGVEGLVTAADILAAIAGDLPDRDAPDLEQAVRRDDGSWLIDGMMNIDQVEELLGVKGMAGAGDFHTLAGFVLDQAGHIPKVGASVVWNGIRFEVVDMDGRRIDRVLVVPSADSVI